MLTVNATSLWFAEVSITYWVVYFQYYWLPQMQPQPFTGFCFLMGVIYATLDWQIFQFPRNRWLEIIPAAAILLIELLGLLRLRRRRYIFAFISLSVLAYLLTEFVDTVGISLTLLVTNWTFITSLQGTVTELVFDNVVFGVLIILLWQTQAPMNNLIQSLLGRPTESLYLLFMLGLGSVFLTFESMLQLLNWAPQDVIFMAGVSGTLIMGLSLTTFFLLQTHLQTTHAQAQRQEQAYREQYTSELQRQTQAVARFRHDYENILLGLRSYLRDQDYQGFRQMYIDVRSEWTTSNAADLTIDDLDNIPKGVVRYDVYHEYLLAQQLGVNLFVQIPAPLTATVVVGREVGEILHRSLPVIIRGVTAQQPAMVTLKITEEAPITTLQMTFPVPEDVQLVQGQKLVATGFLIDLTGLLRGLPTDLVSQLRVKRHWGELLVTLPLERD